MQRRQCSGGKVKAEEYERRLIIISGYDTHALYPDSDYIV